MVARQVRVERQDLDGSGLDGSGHGDGLGRLLNPLRRRRRPSGALALLRNRRSRWRRRHEQQLRRRQGLRALLLLLRITTSPPPRGPRGRRGDFDRGERLALRWPPCHGGAIAKLAAVHPQSDPRLLVSGQLRPASRHQVPRQPRNLVVGAKRRWLGRVDPGPVDLILTPVVLKKQ
jgi:hypothetical protein